jgi:hypothetical protein
MLSRVLIIMNFDENFQAAHGNISILQIVLLRPIVLRSKEHAKIANPAYNNRNNCRAIRSRRCER